MGIKKIVLKSRCKRAAKECLVEFFAGAVIGMGAGIGFLIVLLIYCRMIGPF